MSQEAEVELTPAPHHLNRDLGADVVLHYSAEQRSTIRDEVLTHLRDHISGHNPRTGRRPVRLHMIDERAL